MCMNDERMGCDVVVWDGPRGWVKRMNLKEA